MIEVEVDGTPYTNIISASVTKTMKSMANTYSLVVSAKDGEVIIKENSVIGILVDGVKQLTGYIDEIFEDESEGSHTLTYAGRDRTCDFIDSQINIMNDIYTNDTLTLKKLIEKVIDHLGGDLKVIDNVNPEPFKQSEDLISPRVGESAFDFVSEWAYKRQVLLTSNADGNIVIEQSSAEDSGAALQKLRSSDSNNVLEEDFTRAKGQLFNKYIVRGQLSLRALNFAGDTDIASVENQGAEALDSDVRVGRQRVVVESIAYSDSQLKERSKWSKQLAKSRANSYRCSVKGHSMPSGDIWEENKLVQINSENAGISQKMLLESIVFSEGEGEPTISQFDFVEKDVYTVDAKLLSQKVVGGLFSGF